MPRSFNVLTHASCEMEAHILALGILNNAKTSDIVSYLRDDSNQWRQVVIEAIPDCALPFVGDGDLHNVLVELASIDHSDPELRHAALRTLYFSGVEPRHIVTANRGQSVLGL